MFATGLAVHGRPVSKVSPCTVMAIFDVKLVLPHHEGRNCLRCMPRAFAVLGMMVISLNDGYFIDEVVSYASEG